METQRKNTPYFPREKEKALNLWKQPLSTAEFVAHRYRCTIQSLYRWRRQYNGTLLSLANKSSRPHTPHPNRHTEDEITHIRNVIRRNPNIGLNELYGKLRLHYAYKRNPASLYRFLRKQDFCEDVRKKKTPYVPKPYQTPARLGEKMQ